MISDNKIKLNRNSDAYYRQHLVLLKDLPIRNTNSSEKHMRECFTWFYDEVKKRFKTGTEYASFVDNIVEATSINQFFDEGRPISKMI